MRERTIEYQRVENDPYPNQITVKEYPGTVARLLGAKAVERVYVQNNNYFPSSVGWFEIPDMSELRCGSDLACEIERAVRQAWYLEGRVSA